MLIDLSVCTSPGSRQLSKARVIWLCACVRYWPGSGLHVCQLPLFSVEASLCCRKAREKEKESAWRTMGREKRGSRLFPLPIVPCALSIYYYYYYYYYYHYYYYNYCYLYRDTQREPLQRRECQLLLLLL